MKKAIVLTFLVLLLPACGILQQGEGVVFNDTPATTQIETVELVPYYTTNLVNGVDVITTNFVTRSVVKDVEYSKTEINPQVEMVAKNVGGYFGPIGEGVTGLALLALGVYGNVRSSINKRKAIKKQKATTSLVNSIEIAKDVIKDVDPEKYQDFINQIKGQQTYDGTREEIRELL